MALVLNFAFGFSFELIFFQIIIVEVILASLWIFVLLIIEDRINFQTK